MTNNTLRQYISKKFNAIVSGGLVTGPAATLQEHIQTYGSFVLNGATPVTVAEPNFKVITQLITVSLNTVGGTVGAVPVPQTVTAGTGFTVAGTAGDTSTYNYKIEG